MSEQGSAIVGTEEPQESVEAQLARLAPSRWTALVRDVLRSATVEVGPWHVRTLHGGTGGATGGVYRVCGTGSDNGQPATWSVVLKVLRPPAGHRIIGMAAAPVGWATDPGHYSYWPREALAYRSGLLEDLPGDIGAPRCFGVEDRPGGAIWLWLEDLTTTPAHAAANEVGAVAAASEQPWSIEDFARVARHLGTFNGAYLAGQPLPAYDWLSRNWLRSWLERWAPTLELLHEPATWEHPPVRRCFPPATDERVARLWTVREQFLAALDKLPQTLCHRDAFSRNLFPGWISEGREQTIAIDWAFVGPGAVGEEIGQLVAASAIFLEKPPALQTLGETVVSEYLAGLRAAGWIGDSGRLGEDQRAQRLVHFGYAATAWLRWGFHALARPLRHLLRDEEERRATEARWAHAAETVVTQWCATALFLLDLGERALDLLSVVSLPGPGPQIAAGIGGQETRAPLS